ncbi:GerMN domain-containing protein [Mahella australiensis]|uniref:Lipoprotein LpqB, GerMN domain protein n=1 Tax=Mahella australiensis (strain DSM 15567 / CIP 107919 / 50-1 BON) TaxID=697281 RepID=F4A1Z0_MAHA5|nr:GerMN domain-containing protein [Mahella australiensis]AEE96106.1 Lipoprotein LpqB, GerMN domain protein [Mahella australiensis 50-1 BON]
MRRKSWFAVRLIALVILLVLSVMACSNQKSSEQQNSSNTGGQEQDVSKQQPQKTVATLYFTDKGFEKLVTESREIEVQPEQTLVEAVLKELFKGPRQPEHETAIPSNAKLLKVSQAENIVTVDVSKEFDAGDIQEIVARIMIANTLTELPGVKYVKFYKEGQEYIGASGEPLGLMTKMENLQEQQASETQAVDDTAAKKYNMILYFAGSQAMYVVPEVREVDVVGRRYAQTAIEELIKGPTMPGLYPTIPNGTKLRSIKVEDGTAIVDFSKEFKENHSGGSAGELMTINSIVNTLTEFPSIKSVKFLIDGKENETLAGHVVFDQPFTRNEDVIGQRIILYFGNKDANYLVPEYRDIQHNELNIVKRIVQELIKGPMEDGLEPTMPEGLSEKDVLNAKVSGDTAVINFSSNLKTKHKGGSAGETLTVYSIVNSITELPNIKRVQILIDGKVQDTLAGHMALDEPIMRNPNLIKEQ